MDMDLDELDQAVSKIMDKPKGKRGESRRSQAVHPSAHTTKAPLNVVDNTSDSHATPHTQPDHHASLVQVNRPMPKVPERRRTHPGAMDIINPGAALKLAPPSARPARVAANVHPVSPVITPEPPKPVVSPPPPAPTPPEPTPAEVSDEVLASLNFLDDASPSAHKAPPAEPHTPHEKWPDPLDFHKSEDTKEAPPAPPPTLEEKPEPSTPFLVTKVEKRPLGAYAHVEPAPTPAPKATPETPSKPELAQASLQSNQHQARQEDPPDMDELRQMAIPPQYHTEQQDTSEAVHSVYDTKEYHAPPQMMPASHKGGSPWLTVSVVVLIVLIIAAVAIGFFMMTGTFDIGKLW